MVTQAPVTVIPAELEQIVASVFDTMLNLEVHGSAAPWFPASDRLTAAVHLAGVWSGVVLFECSREQACEFAARFLSIEPPEIVDDVVRDVLGELANVIGGNLKCVLAPGIQVSMPAVVDGSDYCLRVCGAALRERRTFQSIAGPFWVSVMSTGA